MRISNLLIVASTIVLAAACEKTQTADPVVTDGRDAGRAVSPSGDAVATRDRSLVRLVNALPSPASVDVVGGDRLLFTNAKYKSVSPYKELADNVVSFRLVATGTDSVLATNMEAMADGNRYTVIVYADDEGDTQVRVLRDEVEPDAGMARIRLINAAAGLGSVDGAMRGQEQPIFDDVDQGNEAGYKDVTPTTGTFEVRAERQAKSPIQVSNLKLEAGKSYTLVVAGRRSSRIDLLSFEDVVVNNGTQLSKLP